MKKSFQARIEALFGSDRTVQGANLKPAMTKRLAELDRLSVNPPKTATMDDLHQIADVREEILALQRDMAAASTLESLLSEVPIPTRKQLVAVRNESLWECPGEARAALLDLQRKFDSERAAMEKFYPANASKAWQAHCAAIRSSVEAGRGADALEGWSRRDFEEDFETKLSASKAAIKRISIAAHEIAQPLAEGFLQDLNERISQREANEKSLAQTYDLPWEPSAVLLLLMKTAQVVRATSDSFSPISGQSPESIATFIL